MGRDAVRLHRAQAGREGDAGGYHRLVPQDPRRLQMPALRGVRRTAADLDRENPEIQAARHGEDGVTAARSGPWQSVPVRTPARSSAPFAFVHAVLFPRHADSDLSDRLLVTPPPSAASPDAAASGRSTAA